MLVVTWTYDPAPRHRSYELLAEAFGWAITKQFSITGCAIEGREYPSGIRLINYLVIAIVSELVLRSARKLSNLIRMYVQPLSKTILSSVREYLRLPCGRFILAQAHFSFSACSPPWL